MKRTLNAYTMIELLMVLAIVAVLLGLALPEMSRMIASYRLKAAVSDLHGAIDLTRSQAIARGRQVQLVPLEPRGQNWSSGWVVYVDTDSDRRPGPREEVIASHGPLAPDIVTSFKFTGHKQPYYIAFNSDGRSCSASSSMAARWGTISLHQGAQIRRIRINMLGRARVCNPVLEPVGCSV